MPELETEDTLRDDLRRAWHRWVDMLVPLRPALYGYCRRLTGNVWDAEDLVQDTLLRAFGHWGVTYPAVRDPRAYLLRTATNVWIDALRRRDAEGRASVASLEDAPASGADPARSSDVRDAGSRLLQRLSPQERAAVGNSFHIGREHPTEGTPAPRRRRPGRSGRSRTPHDAPPRKRGPSRQRPCGLSDRGGKGAGELRGRVDAPPTSLGS